MNAAHSGTVVGATPKVDLLVLAGSGVGDGILRPMRLSLGTVAALWSLL